jgi:hypothetical protein
MANRLRTPEEVKASQIEETKKYLAHAEGVMSELLGPLFGPEDKRIHGLHELNHVLCEGMKLRGLIMALRRYPRFDPACLSAMKPFVYTERVGSENKSVPVMVPTFGVVQIDFSRGEANFNLNKTGNTYSIGRNTVAFNSQLENQNSNIMREARLGQGQWNGGTLSARVPNIPTDVRSRIDDARPCFETMHIVWEAEWSNAPVVDPLIIGEACDYLFLVDKYDVTKLERYISSEMTQDPLK